MRRNGFEATRSILELLSVLKACGSSRDLARGRVIHARARELGDDSNIKVAGSLINMYAKCGSMTDARRVFDTMEHQDVVSWTSLMLGYIDNGHPEVGLELFFRMQPQGCSPDARNFVAALKACTSLAAKEDGREVHGKIIKPVALEKGMAVHSQAVACGYESQNFVANSLIDMYAKCGSMGEAFKVFEAMQHPDAVSWTTLMAGFADNGDSEAALELFSRVGASCSCELDARTYLAALKACTNLAAREQATEIDGRLVKLKSLDATMNMHSQAAAAGATICDIFVMNSLVDLYAKCGSILDARSAFDRMPQHDTVSWNALLLGYAENGEAELSLELLQSMQAEGCVPDARTCVATLKACASMAADEESREVDGKDLKTKSLERGMAVHSLASRLGCDSQIYVTNSLVDMYSKCGSMKDARRLFDRMPSRSVVSWTSLMLGYAEIGDGESCLELFSCMKLQGFSSDSPTYVAALKGCASLGSLAAARAVHAQIYRCGIERDNVSNCVVDVYGKCGSMLAAHQIFDGLSTANLVTWTSLIAGYSRQGSSRQVFQLFSQMREEGLQANSVTFVCLLTACSHAGLVDKARSYFDDMKLDYGISPSLEHYVCMIDVLGRANRLEEMVDMVKTMPFKASAVTWMTVLGACRKSKNVAVGEIAFHSWLAMDNKDSAGYTLMANIYGSRGMWEKRDGVEEMRQNAGARRKPGRSWWTDERGTVHSFIVGDSSHPQIDEIHAKLREMLVMMKEKHDYVADTGSVTRRMNSGEEEDALCGHSERLAMACAIINSAPRTTIRIMKNLRVCDDCHNVTCIISKLEQRVIICRDASRFHIYEDGKCSCGNYW